MTERDRAMERARKQARRQREFYGHLVTYALVCTLLIVIDLAGGSQGSTFIGLDWAYWPVFGWGIFVALNAVQVLFPMSGWEDRKAEELYERERRREFEHH